MDQDRRRPTGVGRWVLVAAVALTGACQEAANTVTASADMEALESPIIFGMVAFMSANGVREGRIQADTAYTYEDSLKVDLRGMTAVFYDEQGLERATVTALEGEWDPETDRMFSRGDVVLLIHSDGSRIESAELNYDPDRDRVWSDSATVQTLSNGTVTTGTSFESDIDFTDVVIMNPRGGGIRL